MRRFLGSLTVGVTLLFALLSVEAKAQYSEAQLQQLMMYSGGSISADQISQFTNKTGAQEAKPTPKKTAETVSRSRKLESKDTSARAKAKETKAEEKKSTVLKPFGADLFERQISTFEPNLKIATPKNYIIGPEDQITIDIYGLSETSHALTVSPDGLINIPYVGIVSVGGLTVEQATVKIKKQSSKVYSSISSGKTQLVLSLGNIRSIKVTILGEAKVPGTYTLPSLATVFNALYVSGGPSEQGSYREIELIRDGKIVAKLDVYDFLLKGDSKANLRLQDQDVIRIPTYGVRVELSGEVKRPALYEILPNETFQNLINFAGGFSDKAYTAKVLAIQNTDKEKKVSNVMSADFATFRPQKGDKYIVETILDRYENRITLSGAVYRPGDYELESNMTLSSLLKKADGVKEDAFKHRAYIKRLKPDNMTRELIVVDLEKVLIGQQDETLKKEDQVVVLSASELRVLPMVTVKGEVKKEGSFEFAEGMTLEDLILLSGGLKVGASTKRIEIARRVATTGDTKSVQTSEVIVVDVDDVFKLTTQKVLLKPYDVVTVRAQLGYQRQRLVRVEGEVAFPGVYGLQRKDERISDIIKRSGGALSMSYLQGASLKRIFYQNDIDQNAADDLLEQKKVDGSDTTDYQKTSEDDGLLQKKYKVDIVFVDIEKVMKNPGNKYDLILEEGDIITIPKMMQTVNIQGEVNAPGNTSFISGMKLRRYLSQAGGPTGSAMLKRAYVKYPNGRVKSTKNLFFVNIYPKVLPGSEIVIPKKDPNKKLIQEIAAIATSLGTIVTTLIAVIALTK